MFTQPKPARHTFGVTPPVQRPPVPARATVTAATSASPIAAGARNTSTVAPMPPASALYLNAQRELDRVLRSLAAKPEKVEPPHKQLADLVARKVGYAAEPINRATPAAPVVNQPSTRPKEHELKKVTVSPQVERPEVSAKPRASSSGPKAAASAEASAPAKSNAAPRTEFKVALVTVALIAVAALAMAVISNLTTESSLKTNNAQLKATTIKLAELTTKQDELAKTVLQQIRSLHSTVAEVKYPSSEFAEAQELFKLGRYADAESTYRVYLLKYPGGRMEDVALNNAAVAAAMRNNCSMAASYVTKLTTLYKHSPLVAQSKNLVATCTKLRSTR